jgi:hypothetical protein
MLADLFIAHSSEGWEVRSIRGRGVLFETLGIAFEAVIAGLSSGVVSVRFGDGREVAWDGVHAPGISVA